MKGLFRVNRLPKTIQSGAKTDLVNRVETAESPENFQAWLHSLGFERNPFTFEVTPDTFVGYREQSAQILDSVTSGNKITLVLGPTGSGKTTLLKWLARQLASMRIVIYLPKPPATPQEFLDILNPYFESGFFRKRRARTLYELPDFISTQLRHKGAGDIVILCDEIHEASDETLMWLRALCDNVEGMGIVLAALPRFERDLGERLETLKKRVSLIVKILSLTKEETRLLIERRMEHSGGSSIFSDDAMNYIYEQSAGFPREILRLSDMALRKAYELGETNIRRSMMEEVAPVEPAIDAGTVPDKQRVILEALVNPTTAARLADLFVSRYKSKQHALRALNNLLRRLMQAGFVERAPFEKTYIYKLSSKAKTAFVVK